jgi:hypothetical protein
MTQNLKNIAIALSIISLFQPLNALELFNPTSTCNEKQAKMMTNKCEKLDAKAYKLCESATVKDFFKCIKGATNVK